MPDMDDFFINDDELAADHQLTLLDEAKIKCLERIIAIANECKLNLELSEKGNFSNNLGIVSSQVSILIDLQAADEENLSDEEMEEVIDRAFKSTTEITFANLNEIIPEENDSVNVEDSSDEDDNSNGTDF